MLKQAQKKIGKQHKDATKAQAFFGKKQHLSTGEKKTLQTAADTTHHTELLETTLTHHQEVEKDLMDDYEALIKAYKKQTKREGKKVTFYAKQAKKQRDKAKNSKLCKKITYVPTLPKAL